MRGAQLHAGIDRQHQYVKSLFISKM